MQNKFTPLLHVRECLPPSPEKPAPQVTCERVKDKWASYQLTIQLALFPGSLLKQQVKLSLTGSLTGRLAFNTLSYKDCQLHHSELVYTPRSKLWGWILDLAHALPFTPGDSRGLALGCLSTVDMVYWLSVHTKWREWLNSMHTSVWGYIYSCNKQDIRIQCA